MVGSRPLAAPNNHWLLHRQAGVGVGAVVGVDKSQTFSEEIQSKDLFFNFLGF